MIQFYTDLVDKKLANHPEINKNIVLILSPNVYNIYRKATQCGACDMKGDIKIPTSVNGTQK
mgnify:CR=1 FL=1